MLARWRAKLLRRQPTARRYGRLRERDGTKLACLWKVGIDEPRVSASEGSDGEMVGVEDGVGRQREEGQDRELHARQLARG